jgi:hypothetical protein
VIVPINCRTKFALIKFVTSSFMKVEFANFLQIKNGKLQKREKFYEKDFYDFIETEYAIYDNIYQNFM